MDNLRNSSFGKTLVDVDNCCALLYRFWAVYDFLSEDSKVSL